MKRIHFVAIGLFLGVFPAANGQVTFEEEALVAGKEVVLTLSPPLKELIFTYRPNSSVAQTDTMSWDTPTQTYAWTPRKAGVVSIKGNDQSMNVSVRYAGVSTSGLLVMTGAAIILFGGVVLAFRTLFRDDADDGTIDMDPATLPDT
jgi:hypothetical protein